MVVTQNIGRRIPEERRYWILDGDDLIHLVDHVEATTMNGTPVQGAGIVKWGGRYYRTYMISERKVGAWRWRRFACEEKRDAQ